MNHHANLAQVQCGPHEEMLGKLMMLDMPRRPPSWAPTASRVIYAHQLIAYQRKVMDAVIEVLDYAAAEIADELGTREENPEIVRSAFEDFLPDIGGR